MQSKLEGTKQIIVNIKHIEKLNQSSIDWYLFFVGCWHLTNINICIIVNYLRKTWVQIIFVTLCAKRQVFITYSFVHPVRKKVHIWYVFLSIIIYSIRFLCSLSSLSQESMKCSSCRLTGTIWQPNWLIYFTKFMYKQYY